MFRRDPNRLTLAELGTAGGGMAYSAVSMAVKVATGRLIVSVTLARLNPWIVPRLQARF